MTDNTTPRVWIGCLACYGAGGVRGEWFDAAEAGEVTPEVIHGRATAHEELWVMDHEGFGKWLEEECPLSHAQSLAERMHSLGYEAEPFILWCRATGADPLEADEDDFRDSYRGQYRSIGDYAEETARDMYGDIYDSWPQSCIDWDRAGRELEYDGYWIEDGYVFGP